DGVRLDRCAPPAVCPRRAGTGDPAVVLLRLLRPQPHHVPGRHYADLEPSRATQGRCRRYGADPVDRPRTGRTVHHRGKPPRIERPRRRRRVDRPRTAGRGAGVRVRDARLRAAVDRHRPRHHHPHRPRTPAVQPDLVVIHVPRRHLRHRPERPGPALRTHRRRRPRSRLLRGPR
ncbi:hypothetical protein STAWA0001_0351, partial [Staphylococcus warneri L37603]